MHCNCRKRPARPRSVFLSSLSLWLASFLLGSVLAARAALQFDIFLGYDNIVPEASWFPVVCEIKNDGPSFNGTVELSPGNYNEGQSTRLAVELPTGTLKRIVIPVFSSIRGGSWDIRLLDERGKTRAEQLSMRARKQIARGTPLIGALSRTPGGAPVLRATLPQAEELQPSAARLLPAIFPDNPIVLEGLNCLYLNSERAVDLTKPQVNAIFAWLNAGGHLVIAVEQPSDISSSPWLKELFPVDVQDLRPLSRHPELDSWLRDDPWPMNSGFTREFQRRTGRLRQNPDTETSVGNPFSNLPTDLDFQGAEMQVAVGPVREGAITLKSGETPLMVTSTRGSGRVTALLFSPEREPTRSWKNLGVFWAKLAEVPGVWYVNKDSNFQGGWSSDGIFGAMIDSRQVHRLPIGWLLLLLLVYLVVIGPLDQFWLKRIGKPMLTWITFPCYVVIFSLVIYFIGYKLRAGESEWNELHLVDVLANGERAQLRGRSYASIYSPSNQRYSLGSQQQYATFRTEFAGFWGGNNASEKATVVQNGDNFKADIFVPVWTSELFVSDWWQPTPVPLIVTLQSDGASWKVSVDNRTERKLTHLQLAIGDRIIPVGEVAEFQTKTFTVSRDQGLLIQNFVRDHGSNFQTAIGSRRQAFGSAQNAQLSDLPNSSVAASFLSQLGQMQNYVSGFLSPPGLDLSVVVARGSAILFAWEEDYSPTKPICQFSPRRTHRNTLWRVPVQISQ
jgi:hypothetical protein